MHPIPGNIQGAGVTGIARYGRRNVCDRLVIGWPVKIAFRCRPEASAVMMMLPGSGNGRRVGRRRRSRMRRCGHDTTRGCRLGERRFVGGKNKRDGAERSDQQPMHFIGHGTHPLVGYGAGVDDARPGISCRQMRN